MKEQRLRHSCHLTYGNRPLMGVPYSHAYKLVLFNAVGQECWWVKVLSPDYSRGSEEKAFEKLQEFISTGFDDDVLVHVSPE